MFRGINMQKLYFAKTKSTPEIQFDVQNQRLRIEGQSYPENAFKFYEPVFAWLNNYFLDSENRASLEIVVNMPYINTSSSKCVMMILEKLEEAHQNGRELSVRWYYDMENETAKECAEEFKEDMKMPFELLPVEEEK
jgi:hypothetical protein